MATSGGLSVGRRSRACSREPGRETRNAVSDGETNAVIHLASTTNAGANHTVLTELLRDWESIDLSRPSVRRILTSAGITSPRQRRPASIGCDGSGCPRLECWCGPTAVSTAGWAMTALIRPFLVVGQRGLYRKHFGWEFATFTPANGWGCDSCQPGESPLDMQL